MESRISKFMDKFQSERLQAIADYFVDAADGSNDSSQMEQLKERVLRRWVELFEVDAYRAEERFVRADQREYLTIDADGKAYSDKRAADNIYRDLMRPESGFNLDAFFQSLVDGELPEFPGKRYP
jgi:hypothetical protein